MTVAYKLSTDRIAVDGGQIDSLLQAIFRKLGCTDGVAASVALHLVDASLSGVESHGVMRVLQYAEQFRSGYMDATATPVFRPDPKTPQIDGRSGIGIPAMDLAFEHAVVLAKEQGLTALAIRNVGHTGRHGAYADWAAGQGVLTILIGGGNRKTWRQVAPHGGSKGMLPTNPYCIGIPGGAQGPVVLDFATACIAGGWIYAADSAGAELPAGTVIDAQGHPTRDPGAYFQGGAILPAAGAKGYAMALVAELIGEAMLGPATTECHWLLIALDTGRWREAPAMSAAVEEILAELRACPPAPGFDRVEIPGERERNLKAEAAGMIHLPEQTWAQVQALAGKLGVCTMGTDDERQT